MSQNKELIRISNLKKHFPLKKSSIFSKEQLFVKANDGISISINEGETFGLVGESGCGKSTLGRVLLQLYPQTQGNSIYYGKSIYEFKPAYVTTVLSKLGDEVAKYKKALEEANKVQDDENHTAHDVETKLFNRIARLVGGLMFSSDLSSVSKILLEQYKLGCEIAAAYTKNNGSSNDEIVALETKMDELASTISEMKKVCSDNEDFVRAEDEYDTGIDLTYLTKSELRVLRQDLQIIFQDPYSSLNPKLTVGQIISEALTAHNIYKKGSQEMEDYILEVMDKCGLDKYFLHRYPHQFSGGQRQRIGIARALALNPKFIVCDEAVSALDVSIQSQIINLLQDLKEEEKLTYLFITHDLSVVKYISDRIGVMYLGNMVELANAEDIFRNPSHPYTQALMNAIPTTDVNNRTLHILEGDIPSPINPPKGCKFHTRCEFACDVCKEVNPRWREIEPGHFVACHKSDPDMSDKF